MNVIRDIFSILIILCVLCLQFDSVQLQASENDQMRGTTHDKPHASTSVKAPQLQERESNLSVTLTTTKNEIDGRREITRKRKSKNLHNRLKDSNLTVTLNTTKKEIEGSKKSTRKRKSEKLLNKHKESNSTDTPNTTKKEIEKKKESGRKKKSEKLRNQHKESNRKDTFNTTKTGVKEKRESAKKSNKESNSKTSPNTTRKDIEETAGSEEKSESEKRHEKPSGEVGVDTTRKNSEESGESTRKRKSQGLLNHEEPNSITAQVKKESPTNRKSEEEKESTKRRNNETQWNQNKESNSKTSPNMTRKDIEERADRARRSESEKLLNHKTPSGEVGVGTTRKNSEESGESTRKRKSQELLNHEEPNNITARVMEESPKNIKSEEENESTKRRNNETQWKQNNSGNEDWKEIPEQKNNEVDQESRKQLSENMETTVPWPKQSYKNNNRYHKRGRSPIFMRQQETGGNDNKDDEEDPVPEVLNVYSLREDMMRILSEIPNINASVGVIGRTAEYNDIVLCKITDNNKTNKPKKLRANAEDDKYTDEEAEKKIIFIVHGLSAMGFNAVPCLYQEKEFIKLLKLYTEHLDKFDIYLIPIANPDGVSDQPLSNKNKSPQAACSGVALDRNFDISWNAFHVNSCHQQYPGPNAFSEPESRAVGDILHQFNNRIAAYINVHAGTYSAEVFKGDAVLYPKGFVEFNSDDDKYMDIKGEIDEALRIAGFKVMSVSVETLYNWYGKVTGSSVDYAYSVYGIPYALEFVMQPYEDNALAASTEKTSENVLTEIWKRVIDVIFTNINRNNQNNEVNK